MRRPHSKLNRSNWNPREDGQLRCGRISCGLKWKNNIMRPDITFSVEEEDLIIRLHSLLGDRWSLIARRIPGRSVDEIKSHWNSHLSKRKDTLRLYSAHKKTCKKEQHASESTKVDLNIDGFRKQDVCLYWLESELEDRHGGGESVPFNEDCGSEALLDEIYKEYQKLL